MNHHDHVALLTNGIATPGGIWADLGAGDGAFTLALAELIGATGTIYAVDRDEGALHRLARAMQQRFPDVTLHTQHGDFTRPLQLPALDGIVMANSLHFIHHKTETLARIRDYLRPGGRLLMVEYNSDRGCIIGISNSFPKPVATFSRFMARSTTRLLSCLTITR